MCVCVCVCVCVVFLCVCAGSDVHGVWVDVHCLHICCCQDAEHARVGQKETGIGFR